MPRTLDFKGSSNVKSATLNDDGTTEVAFANGGKATYQNISDAMFDEWEAAESAGRWFHNRVRSKPTDFPMVSQVKDAEKPTDATPDALPPVPSAPIAAATNDQGAALAAANGKIAALQNSLEQALARADRAEQDCERLTIALEQAKRTTPPPAQSNRFRPWRDRG